MQITIITSIIVQITTSFTFFKYFIRIEIWEKPYEILMKKMGIPIYIILSNNNNTDSN